MMIGGRSTDRTTDVDEPEASDGTDQEHRHKGNGL
jgi:hypothetical protein